MSDPYRNAGRRVQVFGPAYLDRVLKADRPLVDPELTEALDLSVEGVWIEGEGLAFEDPAGSKISIDLPADWPGPHGLIRLSKPLVEGGRTFLRSVCALSWHDDLGGMGAGYAAALGGTLVSALGPENDSVSRFVSARLKEENVEHHPLRLDAVADSTLLVTSGPYGDKLPFGFRGCHSRIETLLPFVRETELRVVAGLPNKIAAELLQAPGRCVRFFAPAIRNMTDQEVSILNFAEHVDLLCCNRHEWEALECREQVAWMVSILVVTLGSEGALIRFTTENGEPGLLRIPSFPRDRPPVDTNRAGEAFASRFVACLLEGGWKPGVASSQLISDAAFRASAASALELDMERFGFPSRIDVEAAVGRGRIG